MAKRKGKYYSDKAICEALYLARGVISVAATHLHCSRTTITERARTSRKVAAALEEAKEERLDLAEAALIEALEQHEPWAIKFFLTMKGQPRGYSQTHVLEVAQPRQVIREELGDDRVKALLAMRVGHD